MSRWWQHVFVPGFGMFVGRGARNDHSEGDLESEKLSAQDIQVAKAPALGAMI